MTKLNHRPSRIRDRLDITQASYRDIDRLREDIAATQGVTIASGAVAVGCAAATIIFETPILILGTLIAGIICLQGIVTLIEDVSDISTLEHNIAMCR